MHNDEDIDKFEEWYFRYSNELIKANPILKIAKNELEDAFLLQQECDPFTKQDILKIRWAFDSAWRKLQGF